MMFSQETLENKLSIDSLTGLPQLQFDLNHRNTYEKEEQSSESSDAKGSLLSNEQIKTIDGNPQEIMNKSTQQTTLFNSVGASTAIKIVGANDSHSDDRRKSSVDSQYVYKGQPYSFAINDL